ncbi:MAG: hypothetical protein U9N85_11870 [Bacteroidota bacterium]|nr:hypothetical protein [Bacteroidota bacterium]
MDRVYESLKNNRLVFWEEVARDGAQAKTILSAKHRIKIARAHANIFGNNGPDHLVFGVGFTSIGKEERETIREVADHIDNCYLGINCRSNKEEIKLSYDTIKNAKYGRIAFVLPASKRLCDLMMHKTPKQAFELGTGLAKYALDIAQGIPIDIQLAGAFDSDPELIAETSSVLSELGVATVGLGDTRGAIYPKAADKFMDILLSNSDPAVNYSSHFHDDFGFSLVNNLSAIEKGIRLPSTSWLGLAERNGLTRTELILFILANENEQLLERTGINGKQLFLSKPDLLQINSIAQQVSKYTGVPIKVTDPIIGTGVNSISTGTPFIDTYSFQPFDPQKILNIPRTILITQLASKRVIYNKAEEMGYQLTKSQAENILKKIKAIAYKKNRSIMPKTELKELFERTAK